MRLSYRSEAGTTWVAEVDPWAVAVRHGRWYLLCQSHAAGARRAYRVDRVRSVEVLAEGFQPPADLDPVAVLEEHLAVGWEHDVEVLVEAPAEQVAARLPPAVGRVEEADAATARVVGSTSNPWWYAEQLAGLPVPYRILACPDLREAAAAIGRRLLAAAGERP